MKRLKEVFTTFLEDTMWASLIFLGSMIAIFLFKGTDYVVFIAGYSILFVAIVDGIYTYILMKFQKPGSVLFILVFLAGKAWAVNSICCPQSNSEFCVHIYAAILVAVATTVSGYIIFLFVVEARADTPMLQ